MNQFEIMLIMSCHCVLTGNVSSITERLEVIKAQNGPVLEGHAIGRVRPSTSILMQTLIQIVCSICENDPELRNKLYHSMLFKILIKFIF